MSKSYKDMVELIEQIMMMMMMMRLRCIYFDNISNDSVAWAHLSILRLVTVHVVNIQPLTIWSLWLAATSSATASRTVWMCVVVVVVVIRHVTTVMTVTTVGWLLLNAASIQTLTSIQRSWARCLNYAWKLAYWGIDTCGCVLLVRG